MGVSAKGTYSAQETYSCSKCGADRDIPKKDVELQLERLEALDRVADDCHFTMHHPTFEAKAARARWSKIMDQIKEYERRYHL